MEFEGKWPEPDKYMLVQDSPLSLSKSTTIDTIRDKEIKLFFGQAVL